MDDETWRACADPGPMLEYLRGKASDRKLRLFACACARRLRCILVDRPAALDAVGYFAGVVAFSAASFC